MTFVFIAIISNSNIVNRSLVIQTISPGSNFRNYLESRESLTVDNLLKIMHSHFSEGT